MRTDPLRMFSGDCRLLKRAKTATSGPNLLLGGVALHGHATRRAAAWDASVLAPHPRGVQRPFGRRGTRISDRRQSGRQPAIVLQRCSIGNGARAVPCHEIAAASTCDPRAPSLVFSCERAIADGQSRSPSAVRRGRSMPEREVSTVSIHSRRPTKATDRCLR
jgi:hypothetical protein